MESGYAETMCLRSLVDWVPFRKPEYWNKIQALCVPKDFFNRARQTPVTSRRIYMVPIPASCTSEKTRGTNGKNQRITSPVKYPLSQNDPSLLPDAAGLGL